MGRYFEHLTEEEEIEITKKLFDKYGPMSLSEIDYALKGEDDDKGLADYMDMQILTDEHGRGFKIRYIDPQPIDSLGNLNSIMIHDEVGHWDTSKIEKHWKVGAKQEDNQSQGNIQFTKPKQKTMDTKQVSKEPEATQILNKLCNIEDLAYSNRNLSRDIKVRLFGIEPIDPEVDPRGQATPEAWFGILNEKLDNINAALVETSDNLARLNGGTSF